MKGVTMQLRRLQRGVTLIEVLIAMLVTSIGLLGLAGLQIFALKNNQSAALQAQANILAYDMLDRMRGNRALAEADRYDIGIDDADPTSNKIQDRDIKEWRDMLGASLPDGTGAIACDGRVCTVTVQWEDANPFDPDDSTRTIELVSTL